MLGTGPSDYDNSCCDGCLLEPLVGEYTQIDIIHDSQMVHYQYPHPDTHTQTHTHTHTHAHTHTHTHTHLSKVETSKKGK